MNGERNFIKQFVFEKKYLLARHIVFWSVGYIFLLAIGSQDGTFKESFKTAMIYLPFNILCAYIVIYGFVPWFLIRGKYGSFLIAYFIWLIIGMFINFGIRYFILFPLRAPPQMLAKVRSDNSAIFRMAGFLVMNMMTLFALTIKVVKQWVIKHEMASRLEKENISAELQLLKAQLHPQFFV